MGDTNIRDKYKLDYLIKLCAPKIREMITSTSLLEESEGYRSARNILHDRYGQHDLYLHEMVASLADGPIIRSRDGTAMRELADAYFRAMQTVTSAGLVWMLGHSYITNKIVARVPSAVIERFHDSAADLRGKYRRFINPVELYALLNRQARAMLHGASRAESESVVRRNDRQRVDPRFVRCAPSPTGLQRAESLRIWPSRIGWSMSGGSIFAFFA